MVTEPDGGDAPAGRRDYDVEHYAAVLRDTFAARLARALAPDDFAAVFGDPDQLSLFPLPAAAMRPVLTALPPPALPALAASPAPPGSPPR